MNFDESTFSYKDSTPTKESDYDFLSPENEPSILFRNILESPTPASPLMAVTNCSQDAPTKTSHVVIEAPKHAMSTRSKHGISKSKEKFSLLAQSFSPLPESIFKI